MEGYRVTKATGKKTSYWDLDVKPADTDEYEYYEYAEGEKPELDIEDEPLRYRANTFVKSCFNDTDIMSILDKLTGDYAKYESRIIRALDGADFESLEDILDGLLLAEVVTQSDYDKFANKLSSETGVQLGG